MQRVKSALDGITKALCSSYKTHHNYDGASRILLYEQDGCAYCEHRHNNYCSNTYPTVQIRVSLMSGEGSRWHMKRLVDDLVTWVD